MPAAESAIKQPSTTPASSTSTTSRISIPEIAKRLSIGRLAVYAMLEQGILPGVRLGRRWIVTRQAYERWERWERSCGTTGLPGQVGGNV